MEEALATKEKCAQELTKRLEELQRHTATVEMKLESTKEQVGFVLGA